MYNSNLFTNNERIGSFHRVIEVVDMKRSKPVTCPQNEETGYCDWNFQMNEIRSERQRCKLSCRRRLKGQSVVEFIVKYEETKADTSSSQFL